MPIELNPSSVSFGDHIVDLDAFPELASLHLSKTTDTLELEVACREMVDSGTPYEALAQLIRRVCRWGGYPGIAGRVLKNNDASAIRDCFLDATTSLREPMEVKGPEAALAALNRLYGLGAPSFASKHLRFLDPKRCPVLDRLISKECGYPLTRGGYSVYASDCALIGDALEEKGVVDPIPGREGCWYAADIDAAVFAAIRGWTSRA